MATDIRTIQHTLTAQDQASPVFRQVEGGVERLKSTYSNLIGVIAGASAIGGFGIVIKNVVATQAALQDLSIKTGDNVTTLDGLRKVAKLTGTDFDSVGSALTKLARNLNAADDDGKAAGVAIKAIGLDIDSLKSKKPGEAFFEIALALNKYQDGAAKVALVMALMGKAAAEQLPMMKELAEQGELHGKVTAEQARQAQQLERDWRRLNAAMDEGKRTMAAEVIPTIAALTSQLAAAVKISGSFWGGMGLFAGTSNANPGDQIRTINTQLDKLRETQSGLSGQSWGAALNRFISPEDLKIIEAQISVLEKRKKLLLVVQAQDALAGAGGEASFDAKDYQGRVKPQLQFAIPQKTLGGGAAAEKISEYDKLLARLDQELIKSKELSRVGEVLLELDDKRFAGLSQGQRKALLDKAALVDIDKIDAHARQEATRALQAEEQAREQADEKRRTFVLHLAKQTERSAAHQGLQDAESEDRMRFEIAMIGKTADEQMRLTALRNVDLEVVRRSQEARDHYRGYEAEGLAGELARIKENGEKRKQIEDDLLRRRIEQEREWLTGARGVFNDYVAHANNASEQAALLFGNGIKSMEDALVTFAKTGKLDFKSLADSIISDILRIQARQAIAGFLGWSGLGGKAVAGAGALDGAFGGAVTGLGKLLGFGGSGGSGSLGLDAISTGQAVRGFSTSPSYDDLLGFATGGDFAVGGSGGTDSQLVSFMATPGESVSVRTPGQQAAGAGGTFYIDNRGADHAAVARLESTIRSLGGRVMALDAGLEVRSIAAVAAMAGRGGSYSRALRG